MEIIDNRALKLVVRDPDRITSVIPNSKKIGESKGLHEVLVKWGLEEAHVLKNLKIKNVPSPILSVDPWPGLYKPFQHQRETASFLTMHRRAYCFDEMGLGKSASVAWAADYLMSKGIIKRALIICPLSIMDSAWRADLFRIAMHRSVDIAHGTRDKRIKIIESGAEFTIINYDGVKVVQKQLEKAKFDLIVLDESNYIKNANIPRWTAINSIIHSNSWVWMMTGSPASQSPVDAYGLAKMMDPSSVPRYFGAFRDAVMYKVTPFKWAPKGGVEAYIHQVLQPAIRHTKEECLDLPPRTYVTREVPLTPQQAKYYKILRDKMLVTAAGEQVTTVNAAVNLNKLLQLSSGSTYTDTGEVLEFDISNRYSELLEIIEESSKKVIVFANFRHTIEILQERLKADGYSNEVIHGGISAGKRTEVFKSFQTEKHPRVLVIQPQSASHGVTLTAANTIVWWGPVTSYETFVQANDRVHRAGQDSPCTVVQISGSPVETKLYASLSSKESTQKSLMSLYEEALKV